MHLAIDASRCTVAKVTGTENYAIQLISHLIALNETLAQPHHITLYFRDTPKPTLFPSAPHVQYKIIPFRRAWTHLRFAYEIARDNPTVTFVPAHTLPFVMRGNAVVTVHDLGYRLFPQAHPRTQRLYLELTTRYSAHRAQIIFADSHATKRDLTHFYGIEPNKITVVYPAVTPPNIHHDDIHKKYRLPERYFIFIGTLQPRKNIARLVQAYAQFRQNHSEIGLVLTGGKGWLYDDAWVNGVEGVYPIGYIDERDKGALLAKSEGLVFPSLYEGFGFPVIEAMYCGTPVIASHTSSLPELVGDAGIQVNPLDPSAIAHAMTQLVNDRPLRETLITRGYAQAQQFSWQASARIALEAFTRLPLS